MTTSPAQSFLTEILEGQPIPVGKLEYFRARLRSHLHQVALKEWLRQEDRGLTQAELGRRIGKKPEVINRLLGAPGNWTLNTVSDLLIGMHAIPNVQADDLIVYLAPADGDTVARADALVKGLANRSASSESNTKQLLDKLTSQAAGAALMTEPTTSAANTSPFEGVPQPRIAEMEPQSELGDFVKKVG